MFYYHDGVPLVDQLSEDFQQYLYIFKMQACRRFVENIEGISRRFFEQFRREFHPLAFSAGKGDRRLSEMDIPESHVDQGTEFLGDLGDGGEELESLADAHLENIVDALALVVYSEGVFLVSSSTAFFARNVHGREEIHLYFLDSRPLAFLASSARNVE